ncbi:MAG TPA: glutamate racemase [Edaphocola sp.]|nr:glutamate racemase [Edaphocola sp.]
MSSIGIFDSGYGGLTIFKSIVELMPEYNYIYLGDNARAPYGNRNTETIYQFTLEAVNWLFSQGCDLVVLACNTASAKALRTIQQNDLRVLESDKRVLGVIRPTAEEVGHLSQTKHIGILGTEGTIQSEYYLIEIADFFPEIIVTQHACPQWVPLIEACKHKSKEALAIFNKDLKSILNEDKKIDTLVLACTHYPLIKDIIKTLVPPNINILSQAEIIANSLKNYFIKHSDFEVHFDKDAKRHFYTTGNTNDFEKHTKLFFGHKIKVEKAILY